MEKVMVRTFGILQGSPKGWKIGYCGFPGGKTYWGLTFPTLPGAMEFIKKQSPGKLVVVMRADDHLKYKCKIGPDNNHFTR